jgi:branched-chain amino acid transport system substrate-binding protein
MAFLSLPSARLVAAVMGCGAALLLSACPKTAGQRRDGTRVVVKPSAEADAALRKALSASESRPKSDAVEALYRVRKQYPDTTAGQEALYRVGVLSFEEGQYVQAKEALSTLLYENPLFDKADDARLKLGLSAAELSAWRDAEASLKPLVERLSGDDKARAQAALARAQKETGDAGAALQQAISQVEAASQEEERKRAVAALEAALETAPFLSVAEAWNGLSKSSPAWPALSYKMARVYYHVRDWTHLEDMLQSLLSNAADSPYAADAKQLLDKVRRRSFVKPRVVGAILPMSGKLKALGNAVQRGLLLALKGSDVELVVKDNQGDPSLVAKLVEQLAFEDGAIAIIGPLFSEDSRRAGLVAEELQIPLLSLARGEGITDIGPHVFRTMVTSRQQANALAEHTMKNLGFKSFAVLFPNIPFGTEFTNEFWDAVEARGGTVKGAESYEHDQTTFTSEAKKLVGRYYLEDRADYFSALSQAKDGATNDLQKRKAAEKAKDTVSPIVDFDALLIPDAWDRVALVAPALAVEDVVTNACDSKDMQRAEATTGRKLKSIVLLGPSTWSSPNGPTGVPQLVERGGKYINCSLYVDGFFEGSDRKEAKTFVKRFREQAKDAPLTLLDAVAYDTGGLLRSVLEAQSPTTRAALRSSLSELKNYEGAMGPTGFDAKREAKRPLFLLGVSSSGVREVVTKTKGDG